MAKQVGQFLLKGLIGNASFYLHPEYGPLVRGKSSLNKDKVYRKKNSRTLDNATEFKQATRAAVLLRRAVSTPLKTLKESWLSGRMNALLLNMVQSDTSTLGSRSATKGDPSLLVGFNFRKKEKLEQVFQADYRHHIDASTGHVQIDIAPFLPLQCLEPPAAAKYFQLLSIATVIDFIEEHPIESTWQSDLLDINEPAVPALQATHQLALRPGHFIVLTLGILFYTQREDIPAGMLSQNKRRRLGKNSEAVVPYMGALKIIGAATIPNNV